MCSNRFLCASTYFYIIFSLGLWGFYSSRTSRPFDAETIAVVSFPFLRTATLIVRRSWKVGQTGVGKVEATHSRPGEPPSRNYRRVKTISDSSSCSGVLAQKKYDVYANRGFRARCWNWKFACACEPRSVQNSNKKAWVSFSAQIIFGVMKKLIHV